MAIVIIIIIIIIILGMDGGPSELLPTMSIWRVKEIPTASSSSCPGR